ncbi:MAG: hypothetical protein GX647_09095 [Clostridiales bacterium]|nr:hypothetical protein [Clostridiales bacterium]
MNEANAALYGRCEEILIRLALEELALEEADAAAAEPEEAESGIPEESLRRLYQRGHRRLQQGIRRGERDRRRRRFLSKALPRAARIAAAVICVFYLGLTVAYAAIPAVRHRVFQLLIRFEETHAQISLEPGDAFEVPEAWTGEYFPTYVPSGFSLFSIECDVFGDFLEFRDEEGTHYIRLGIRMPETVTNINSEDAAISYQSVQGFEVMFASRPDLITAVWQNADRYFVASSNILEKAAMEKFIAGIVNIS